MQIVIDIPEWLYDEVKTWEDINDIVHPKLAKIIKNCTPLPKGHGRLIDADELHHCDCKGNFNECDTCVWDDLCNLVNGTPTIIEADKEI